MKPTPLTIPVTLHSDWVQFDAKQYETAPDEWEVRTRDERPVRVLCTDKKDRHYPVVALVNETNSELCENFTEDGVYRKNGRSGLDLFMRRRPTLHESHYEVRYHNGELPDVFPTFDDNEAIRFAKEHCEPSAVIGIYHVTYTAK